MEAGSWAPDTLGEPGWVGDQVDARVRLALQ